jgi:D-tyrosyl-tRNA(Tyr) deacylase
MRDFGKDWCVRAVIQRVTSASARVEGRIVGSCGPGLVVLLGVADGDSPVQAEHLAGKIARLRVLANADGRFGRSVLDAGGQALVVSQFTLIADAKRQKGTRPDFSGAARPEVAEPVYEKFCQTLRELGVHTETGIFGAQMQIELVNDGPVTMILEA